MGLEESGIKLVVDGLSDFKSGMEDASKSLGDLEGAEDSAGESSNILSDALDSLGSIAAKGLAVAAGVAAAGVAALGAVLVEGIGGALETEQTMARLESQLAATGGAAGLTMQDLQDLGTQFQDLAGGTDDPIYAIESIGLKFSNITKDVMPGFIQASLDMAAVMGTDATSAAQMLAMALEDPVGSMGRLKRAGIIFTEDEKKQIKAMTEAGDAAGAQKMILDKLAATTGGAAAAQAETLAGKWEIFKGRMGEAAEAIGMALLPKLTTLFDTVVAPAIPVLEDLATAMGYFFEDITAGSPAVEVFGESLIAAFGQETGSQLTQVIRDLFDGISGFVNLVIANWPLIQSTFETVFGVVMQVGGAVAGFVTGTLMPALSEIWTAIVGEGPSAQEVFTTLMNAISTGATIAGQFIVNTLIPAVSEIVRWLTDNLVPIIIVVREWLAVNLPIAIQAAADFWNGTLLPAITAVWSFIQVSLIPIITDVVKWLQENLPIAMQAVSDFWYQTLGPALQKFWDFLNTSLVPLITTLANVAMAAVSKAMEGIDKVWRETLSPALTDLWEFIRDTLAPLFDGFIRDQLDRMSASLDAASTFVIGLIDWLKKLADWISKIDWGALTPGSPTPFELGLRGATDAARELARSVQPLGSLGESVAGAFAGATFGAAGASAAPGGGVGVGAIGALQVGTMSVGTLVMPALPGAGGGTTGGGTTNQVTVNANYARMQDPPALVSDFNLAMALL